MKKVLSLSVLLVMMIGFSSVAMAAKTDVLNKTHDFLKNGHSEIGEPGRDYINNCAATGQEIAQEEFQGAFMNQYMFSWNGQTSLKDMGVKFYYIKSAGKNKIMQAQCPPKAGAKPVTRIFETKDLRWEPFAPLKQPELLMTELVEQMLASDRLVSELENRFTSVADEEMKSYYRLYEHEGEPRWEVIFFGGKKALTIYADATEATPELQII